ncbi:MAG: hypothetical protein HDR13_13825 [Lachnospiraceae bacterium]|nr:hypothetical protein [Lachnospiraceae bacterium]
MKMKNSYRILECLLLGMGVILFGIRKLDQKCIDSWKTAAARNQALYVLMNRWTYIKQEGKKLQTYFLKRNIRKIAVYGMGDVGRRLIKELQHSEVEIMYGIDRNAKDICSSINLVTMDDDLPDVDAIVVTLLNGYDEVAGALSERIHCPVIAIEDVLNEV